MREIIFLKKNETKWRRLEAMLKSKEAKDPDELSHLFTQLTDDLAYAQTFYPDSKTTLYLNQLSGMVRLELYKNKKEDRARLTQFWLKELPLLFYRHRNLLATAFILFFSAFLIGWFSASYDKEYIRLILGDPYVDATLLNIESGKPMNVYGDSSSESMFSYIAFNNIRVSFLAFVGGLLWGLGTVFLLLYNGIMVGAFLRMFYDYNVLTDALLAVWMHGTIEISIIIVAGMAGLIIGKSLLFPGTYSRLYALSTGAKEGAKIIIGLIPCFIIAAYIESYLTRHYTSVMLSTSVILLSLAFITTYFVVLPYYIGSSTQARKKRFYGAKRNNQHYFIYGLILNVAAILSVISGIKNAYSFTFYIPVMFFALSGFYFIYKSNVLSSKSLN